MILWDVSIAVCIIAVQGINGQKRNRNSEMDLRSISSNQPFLGPDNSQALHISRTLGLLREAVLGSGIGVHRDIAVVLGGGARRLHRRSIGSDLGGVAELAALRGSHPGHLVNLGDVSARHGVPAVAGTAHV